jgi:hypothetical protein
MPRQKLRLTRTHLHWPNSHCSRSKSNRDALGPPLAHSIRQIMRALNAEQVRTPTGKAEWWHSTACRILRNETYIGHIHFNQTETVATKPTAGPAAFNGPTAAPVQPGVTRRSPVRPDSQNPSTSTW